MQRYKVITIIFSIFLFSCGSSAPADNPATEPKTSTAVNQCGSKTDSLIVIDQATSINLSQQIGFNASQVEITLAPNYGELRKDNESLIYTSNTNQLKIDQLAYQLTEQCGGEALSVIIASSNSTIATSPIKYPDGGTAQTELLDIDIINCAARFLLVQQPSMGVANINSETGAVNYSANIGSKGIDSLAYQLECNDLVSEPIWINAIVNTLELNIPSVISAPVNETIKLYFDNLINSENTENYRFEFSLDGRTVGRTELNYWAFTALEADIGSRELKIDVFNNEGILLATNSSTLNLYTSADLSSVNANILFIGDSLTANGYFVSTIKNISETRGLNGLNYQGSVEAQGVNFEAYGGNTWRVYNQILSPKNPFFYADSGLDFERYFNDQLAGDIPQYIFIMLGVNDIFSKSDNSHADILSSISSIFETAEQFIAALQLVAPDSKIIIGSISPPNARAEAFIDDYGSDIRQRYRNLQHIFVKQQELQFSYRQEENIFFFPIWHNLDTTLAYPADNALHPNPSGYEAMAHSFTNEFIALFSE